MNTDALGRRVTVVESAADLEAREDVEAAEDGSAVAWARSGRAYLIADRIRVGTERGVFLHEVGGHLGLERMLKPEEFSRLVGKIVSWAGKNNGSTESQLAKLAMARVEQAGTKGAEARNAELVAYFIEEAVNAGVNPTAVKYDGELARWMRTLWAAFKTALRRLGVNPDRLTAQDVVDLAYGAARLNITGRFHGTAAKVRQFRTKYIGTGEGAQAYGWGLYFSELRGVAEEYKKSDVARKTPGAQFNTDVFRNQPAVMAGLQELGQALKAAPLKKPFTEMRTDDFAVTDLLGLSGYVKHSSRSARAFLRDLNIARMRYGATTMAQAVDMVLAGGARSAPKGNLYATDIAIRDDEFLDWTKPLDEQPGRVRDLVDVLEANATISKAASATGAPEWRVVAPDGELFTGATAESALASAAKALGKAWNRPSKRVSQGLPAGYEKTGGGLYRYLESLAEDGQGPFEPDMRVDDFLDRMVAKYDVMDQEGPNYRRLNSEKLDRAMTAEEAAELKRLQDEAKAVPWGGSKSAPERVSRWLDSIGVKGVRMPVNYQRGGTYTEGRNFVVFNEKNVIRAIENPENRVSKSVQFSKGPSPVEAAAKITDKLPEKTREAWTNISDTFDRAMPYVQTTFQIYQGLKTRFETLLSKAKADPNNKGLAAEAERLGDMHRNLASFIEANDRMGQEAMRIGLEVDEVVKRWVALPKVVKELLYQVTQKATLLGAYPDKDWDDKANAHVPREREAEYDELKRLYNRMKATSPQALKVYDDALALGDRQLKQLEQTTQTLFDQYGVVRPKPKAVPGPYFALVRRGDYIAIGESPALHAANKKLDELLKPAAELRDEEAIAAQRKLVDKMERDDQHYWISFHETKGAMDKALRQYKAQGLEPRFNLADQRLSGLPTRNLHDTIAALTAAATKGLDQDAAKQVENAVATAMLRALPEGHALERQAARRGISGAMPDMARATAIAGKQNAHYISRLRYAKQVTDALFAVKRSAKESQDIQLMHIARELEQRAALNLRFHETPVQDAVGKAAWAWFLGASPTFLAMNLAQPWLVAGPVLSGEYGAAAASKALGRASMDALKVLSKARWTGTKFDLWSGIDPDTVRSEFQGRNDKGEVIGEERKALRTLIERSILDEGVSPELAMYAQTGGTGLLAKLGRAISWPSQQIELVNRMATALAAFRLERAKPGSTYEAALEKAYATVDATQVNYGQENAPRAMREGGGIPLAKLLFQFRRYQQAMFHLLASNIKKLANPAERKVAAATLGYLLLTNAAVGGAIGLPFAGSVMWLLDKLRDDDDEDGDTRTQLRNWLFDLTGDRKSAEVLAKGLPALIGLDVADRLGMGSVGALFPRMDLSQSRTAEEKVGKVALAVGGPAAGLAVQGVDAAMLFGAGDWSRGIERLAPKMFSDPLRAMREATQGMTDRSERQVLGADEIGEWTSLYRVLGAASTQQSRYQEANQALRKVEQAIDARRDRIRAEFRRALRSGDFEDVRELIDEFNRDHPDLAIKPKDEVAWRREAARSEAQRGPDGIKVNPRRDQRYEELMRFARG